MTPRFCYVLLAHTRGDAVARLTERLRRLSPDAAVLVRYGADADLDPAPVEATGAGTLRSEIVTRWGEWSLVEAELEAYAVARERFDPDYYVLLSGQDLPVRDLAAWERQVVAAGADALLGLQEPSPVTVDNRWWVLSGPRLPRPARRVLVKAAWWLTRASRGRVHVGAAPLPEDPRWWVGLPRDRGEREVVKASQWKVLSRSAVGALLHRRETRPEEVAFFQGCKVPDELYVASVLTTEPGQHVVDHRITWMHFPDGAVSPVYLDAALVREGAATPAAFVRKIHPDADATVLAAADEACSR